jgi:hypothetical protein
MNNVAVFISGVLFGVFLLVLAFMLMTPLGQYIALSPLHQMFNGGRTVW